jgi:ATP-binding cassette subfamily G (WHITE) protein 2 (SNQ2)
MSHNATNHLEILFTHCLQSPLKDFHTELRAQKAKRANKKSKYSASIWEQMYALIVRQGIIVSTYHPSSLQLIYSHVASMWYGDKFGIFSRYFSVLVQSFIYGSVFYNMPLTATGGFTRGGALMCAIMANAFVCTFTFYKNIYLLSFLVVFWRTFWSIFW